MSRRRFSLLGALIVLAMTGVANAEQAGADALFREGVRALRAGRYDDAASMFRLSYQMEPRASTMCNLALTHERAGRDREALESYRRCAEDDTSGRYRDHALERSRVLEQRTGSRPEPMALRQQPPRQQPPRQPVVQQPGVQQPGVQQPPQVPPTQTQRVRRTHPMLWVGLGVTILGLGGLGAGIGLHSWSSRVHDELLDEYDTQIPANSAAEDRLIRGGNGANAALALYIGGGVVAGLGLILMLLDAGGIGSRERVTYSLIPGRDSLALSITF